MKTKRIYVYRCENSNPEMGEADGLFIVGLEGKGPNPHKDRHQCPHEGCGGYGKFVAVYVPEGEKVTKAGKKSKKGKKV